MHLGSTMSCVDLNAIYINLSVSRVIPSFGQAFTMPMKSYYDLFNDKDLSRSSRIIITGKEGYGKTTLAAKMAHDWALVVGHLQKQSALADTKLEDCPLQKVKLLFVLNMRWIDQATDIEDAILSQVLNKK